jgi:hypothetical protein
MQSRVGLAHTHPAACAAQVTLFFSWLWLCLEEHSNPLEVAIERVIVSPDTGARLKSVLCATGGACVRACAVVVAHTAAFGRGRAGRTHWRVWINQPLSRRGWAAAPCVPQGSWMRWRTPSSSTPRSRGWSSRSRARAVCSTPARCSAASSPSRRSARPGRSSSRRWC